MKINCELLPHQIAAANKLKGLKVGALFMEMGTGKTLTAMELIRQRRRKISKVVYLAPVNLLHSVRSEFARHSPETTVCQLDGSTKEELLKAFVCLVGIESIAQSDRIYLSCNELIDENTCVILDESDTCKNHAALRTMRITAMGARAKYRFALTGTAVGEGIVDLFAQMKFLSPKILGYSSFYSFAANHLEYSENYPGMIVRSLKTDHIAKKIEPYVYQVTKAECLKLPPKIYRSHAFAMTDRQWGLYQWAKEDILLNCPDDEIDSYTIFRLFTALREIVSGFWNQTPHPESWRCKNNLREPVFHTCEHDRLDALEEAIATFPSDSKIIIWANFQYCAKQIIERLTEAYGGEAIATYTGETQDREGEIERWRGPARLLVASPKAGGRGLTLNESSAVIFYNNDFPYRLRAQAEDRCHRIGQGQSPTYIDLVTGGIDGRIVQALAKKQSLAQEFRREVEKIKDAKSKRAKLLEL